MSSRENLTLELKIICATDVNHNNVTDKMDVYAVVSIIGDNSQTQAAKTPIDYDGGSNPTWNHPVKFSVCEKEAREGLLTVNVKLYSYWLEGAVDLEIGEVNVPVQELLGPNPPPSITNGNGDKMKLVARPVKVTGGTDAKLSFSYRFKPILADGMYPSLPDGSSSFRYPNQDSGRSCQPVINPQTSMTKLTLDLVIKSTKDIKDNSWIHGMDIYASVTIREGTIIKHRSNTPVAFSVHKNPVWDHAIRFSLEELLAREGRLTLFVQLINQRVIRGHKKIGEVQVPICELLASNPSSMLTNNMKLETRDVTDQSGKIGTLNFMYRFLAEQATVPPAPPQPIIPPAPPTTIPQPFIIYIPVTHQAFGTQNPVHGTSTYVSAHPGAYHGTSNSLHPVYIQPPNQPHGHQQWSQHYQPQSMHNVHNQHGSRKKKH